MRKYYNNWKRIFLKPDTDTGGGGSQTGNPAAGQGGGQQNDGSSTDFVDPTAGIDLDELTPEVRTVIEASRKGFATLQKATSEAKAATAAEEQRRKDFQSNYDKLRVQVESLTKSGDVNQDDPNAAKLAKFESILVKRGVPGPQARVQAEIMLEMMTDFGAQMKNEIGKDLKPFASTIVSREADFAWQQAVATDKVGALQIPEIAQHVWNQVQDMATNGQQVTAQIVQNLTGMAYFAHLQEGKEPAGGNQTQQVQQQQQQQLPNVGRLTYPGAGANPGGRPLVNNGNNSVLDPATDAALQSVMKVWAKGDGGVKAPGLRQAAGKGGK